MMETSFDLPGGTGFSGAKINNQSNKHCHKTVRSSVSTIKNSTEFPAALVGPIRDR